MLCLTLLLLYDHLVMAANSTLVVPSPSFFLFPLFSAGEITKIIFEVPRIATALFVGFSLGLSRSFGDIVIVLIAYEDQYTDSWQDDILTNLWDSSASIFLIPLRMNVPKVQNSQKVPTHKYRHRRRYRRSKRHGL